MGIHLPGKSLLETARKAATIGTNLVEETWGAAIRQPRVWTNPAAPKVPARYPLKLVTYNVLRGPQNFDAVLQELKAQSPDVCCLQEVTGDNALKLARALGLHAAVFPNNKAILSRYPISNIENHTYDLSLKDQVSTAWRTGSNEPLERRTAGIASLKVGGKTLDIMDTHLSLHSPEENRSELRQLDALVEAKKQQGHSVLVAGDFNTNFALARSGQDGFEDWNRRHPGKVIGNAGDAQDRAAMRGLLDGMRSHWEEGTRSVQLGGSRLTPEAAQAELQSGTVKPGSRRETRLLTALEGISHGGAGKRFDNVLASPDLRFVSSFIDADSKASDHRPVVTLVTPR
jgi:endonuclease/exonuclease/phosphatase family metal-dependent hydrolase